MIQTSSENNGDFLRICLISRQSWGLHVTLSSVHMTSSVFPYFLYMPMWQNFTISGHNDDKIIGDDTPYPEHKTAVQTFRQTQGRLGASVLPRKPGHSLINSRKPTPTLFNITLPGKPQIYQFQEYVSQDTCWINGEKQEKELMKELGGWPPNVTAPFLKGCLCRCWGQPILRGPLAFWPALALYSLVMLHHGLAKARHQGRSTSSLKINLSL